MIKINNDKYKMGLINKLIKDIDEGLYTNDRIINKLKEIERIQETNDTKDNIITMLITVAESFKADTPVYWGNQKVYNKKELWKELNKVGVYYTVPLWKLDKTIEEITQTRKEIKQLTNKEQQLIKQMKGGK